MASKSAARTRSSKSTPPVTRDGTLERAAEKIRTTRLKVEAYAELLADQRGWLDRELEAARGELRRKVEQLAAAPAA